MTPTAISSTTTRAATMNAPLPLVISGEGIGAGVGLTWAQAAVAVMQSAPAAASAARVPVIWQIRLMASTSWALKAASPMPWGESRRSYRSVGSLPWTDTTGPLSRAGRFFPLQVSFARLCSAGNLAGFAPPAPRLVVQRLRRSAQDGRRSCLVVVHGLERSQDELTLSLLERGAQRQEHGVRAFGLVGGHGAKGQALGRDQIALAGDDGPLDDVSKLADVARPRMLEKPGHGGVVDRFDLTLILLVELRDEGFHEQRQVLEAPAEGRERDGEHVHAIVEILAECLVANRLRGITIGGGHDPDVHLRLRLAAQATDHPVLENAEVLGLQRRAHLRDLVEKDRPGIRQLEIARPPLEGAREGALLVAEELALEEGLGDGRAVDGDERPLGAVGHLMNGARHELLARARLAGEKHGGRAGRREVDQPVDLLHGGADSEQRSEAPALLELAAEQRHFFLDLRPLHRLVQHHAQALRVDRLGQIVVGAVPHRGDRGLDRGMAGQENDHRVRIELGQRLEESETIEAGHLEVGDDDGGRGGLGAVERLLAVDGLVDFVSPRGKEGGHSGPGRFVVISNEHAMLHVVTFWLDVGEFLPGAAGWVGSKVCAQGTPPPSRE